MMPQNKAFQSFLLFYTILQPAVAGNPNPEYDVEAAEKQNHLLIQGLGISWAVIALIGIIINFLGIYSRRVRTIACLHDNQQAYFAEPNVIYARLKKHLLAAPLFGFRHNHPFTIGRHIHLGTLPTRFQSLLLMAYLGANVALSLVYIDFTLSGWAIAGMLRNRLGSLAAANLLPIILLSGRNNPLIKLLDINFSSYNTLHRWLGRLVVLEALGHGMSFMISVVLKFGYKSLAQTIAGDALVRHGLIALVTLVVILLQSPSIVRHNFYEVFLHIHQALVAVVLIVVWLHTNGNKMQMLVIAAAVVWIVERVFRFASLIYRNIATRVTKADVEIVPGNAMRINLRVARPWTFVPGQHLYLYFPTIGLWTNHPFSVAWNGPSPMSQTPDMRHGNKPLPGLPNDKESFNSSIIPLYYQESLKTRQDTTISLIVKRQSGFTSRIYDKTNAKPSASLTNLTALVEGPYGSSSLSSYGTVLLFAAGIGITHQLSHVRALLTAYAAGTCATRRVVLVWVIQSAEHLEWIRQWMVEILDMERRREVLQVLLFVTRPDLMARTREQISSASGGVKMWSRRPDLDVLVDDEIGQAVGTTAVEVCGAGLFVDQIRQASRRWMDKKSVDFVDNSYGN